MKMMKTTVMMIISVTTRPYSYGFIWLFISCGKSKVQIELRYVALYVASITQVIECQKQWLQSINECIQEKMIGVTDVLTDLVVNDKKM